MQYWLMKSEPEAFGIDDLKKVKREPWDGVRNYQARNFMRDDMKKGDLAFFYHSNCKEPGIAGIMEVSREAFPDHTQFDAASKYFDPKSTPDNPRWMMVEVKYRRKLKRVITLTELKEHTLALAGLELIRRGSRLSIMPVSKEHWDYILGLE